MARQPLTDLARRHRELERLRRRLGQAHATTSAMLAQRLAALAGRLEGANPLGILARGYALVTRERDGRLLRAADQVSEGERVRVRLAKGALRCRVEERDQQP
jgi:exodeoxyribonuclease VII large subunit